MTHIVEATYENGVLKLAQPLPLEEHEKVRVTVETQVDMAAAGYGIVGWKGDHETLQRILDETEEAL
jgi:predicted DNA-binding antitoxin AbrB/MazE fold protein